MFKKLLCVLAYAASHIAFAQQVAVGTINTLRAHDSTLWGTDANYIMVDGFTSAGTCPTSGGLVNMAIRGDKLGDRQTVVALQAKALGKQVRVSVDPSFTSSNGTCLLRWIEFAE